MVFVCERVKPCGWCAGTDCEPCGALYTGSCGHDVVERHAGHRALTEDHQAHVPTKPLSGPLHERIEMHVDDAEGMAGFLRAMATIIETYGAVVVTVQPLTSLATSRTRTK